MSSLAGIRTVRLADIVRAGETLELLELPDGVLTRVRPLGEEAQRRLQSVSLDDWERAMAEVLASCFPDAPRESIARLSTVEIIILVALSTAVGQVEAEKKLARESVQSGITC